MKTLGLKVLLVEPDKNQNDQLTGLLIEMGYQVISVRNIETAIRKLLEFFPQIIICQKELKDHSGFHFYTMFKNDLLNSGAPFILLMNEFSKDDLSVGMELGIDSFIFPPFESGKINNILQKQMQKNKNGKSDAASQIRTIFDLTPFGTFLCNEKMIVEANKSFYKMVQHSKSKHRSSLITDVFNFNNNQTNKLNLLRCLNSVLKYCSFKSIPLIYDPTELFDLHLSVIESWLPSVKIIGLIIPVKAESGHNGHSVSMTKITNPEFNSLDTVDSGENSNGLFTSREKQILNLSAQGAPIKQIAEQLGISVRTVEKHRSNIIKKTNSGNITEAVFYAQKKHILELG
jgi:DNA-binding NarL/FixJ family response regulator